MITHISNIYFYIYAEVMVKQILVILVFLSSLSIYGQQATASIDVNGQYTATKIDSELSLFPNPTTDFFAVKQDASIKKIVVYNWLGKKITSFAHRKGRIYNVESLEQGIYIIRLYDDKDKLAKVLRLHRS